MGLTKEDRQAIVTKFGKSEKDSGRTEVQVAILTKRINELSADFVISQITGTTANACISDNAIKWN